MFRVHGRLSALLVITAILTASGAPLAAAQMHPVCAAKQHDCGKAARLTRCCCGDHRDSSTPAGPTESTIRLAPHPMPLAGGPVSVDLIARTLLAIRLQASPPRTARLDLPTLFATLLL